MGVRLIIEDLEGSTTVVPLGSEEVTIGRKEHNTIQLTEQNVSRSHARLTFADDRWLIEDLESYNGVQINGVPIAEPTLLQEGDLIQIGDYHLTLTDDVDRATVDIERPRAAANDDLQAMASAELPSVSVDDLEPLRPPPTSAAGAIAASELGTDDPAAATSEESGKKRPIGMIVGVSLGLAALLGVAIWAAGSGDSGDKDSAGTKSNQVEASPTGAGDTGGAVEVIDDNASGEVVIPEMPADGETGGLASGEPAIPDSAEVVDETGGDDDDMPVIDDPPDTSEPKPKPKPKPDNGSSKPPKPPKPKGDPDALLAQARTAVGAGDNRKAYKLAKQAYDVGRSPQALSLVGVTACKLGSASKAKWAYRRMSAKMKADLKKVCSPLGIELD